MSDTTKQQQQAVPAAPKQSTAVAEKKAKPQTLRDFINSEAFSREVARALPKHMDADRMLRVATTALLKTPELANADRTSFIKAMLDLSAVGLEPDGRHAHLIPFRNNKAGRTDVQLIIDYKGLVKLIRQSGEISTIHADVVFDNDFFDLSFGHDGKLVHKPLLKGDRGEPYAVYSYCQMKDGSEDYVFMTKQEVEAIRKRSRASGSGPWVTDTLEMWKKTVLRRHSKTLPLSFDLQQAIETEDSYERPIHEVTGSDRSVVHASQLDDPFAGLSLPEDASDQPKGEPEAAPESHPASEMELEV